MTDFASIDFETANGYRTSICSAGIVIVRLERDCTENRRFTFGGSQQFFNRNEIIINACLSVVEIVNLAVKFSLGFIDNKRLKNTETFSQLNISLFTKK
jgi:hypothetical protein